MLVSRGFYFTTQWRNDGLAAASRDGGPTGKGPPAVQELLMVNF